MPTPSAPSPAAAAAPEPPACVNHARRPAEWHCPQCRAALCEDCVRVYASRDGRTASCRSCRERCERLLERAEPEGVRAGAVESEEDRRRRHRRDVVIPAALLGGSGALYLLTLGAGLHWLAGPPAAVLWAGIGAAAMALGFRLVCRVSGADFEPVGPTLLKLAAIAVTVHLLRELCWETMGPTLPTSRAAHMAMMQALALLVPLGITFVIAPMLAIGVLVPLLFELDTYEVIVSIAALFIADTLALVAVKMTGLPGL